MSEPAKETSSPHGLWSNKWTFVLAATGSAVGLGNIWRFPYIVGEQGGGAFIVVYLCSIILIGIPIMMAEVLIGREGRLSPVGTLKLITQRIGAHRVWRIISWTGVTTGLLIASYYAVVAGWTLNYVMEYFIQIFSTKPPVEAAARWENFLASPWTIIFFQTIMIILTAVTLGRGVTKGIEKLIIWCMPVLFVLIISLLVYSLINGDVSSGLNYLFRPDFGALSVTGTLMAMGQAFFSLSLGMGTMMSYGAYVPDKVSIPRTVFTIALLDSLVAICAGLVIFPLVFAHGLEPNSGPGLLFITLAQIFDTIPFGALVGTLFFALVAIGALTSLISLGEPCTAWLVEKYNANRMRIAFSLLTLAWLLGIGSALSFNLWSDVYVVGELTIFAFFDLLTTSFMLPIGGFFIVIFAGWILPDEMIQRQLQCGKHGLFLWHLLTRFITPTGVLLLFINILFPVLTG